MRIVIEFTPPGELRVDGPQDVVLMLGLLEMARVAVGAQVRGTMSPLVVPPAVAG